MNGAITITPHATVPTVVPSDPSLSGKVFYADAGNAIDIMGHASAGSGKLYLFRNQGSIPTRWSMVDNDAQDNKSAQVDSTKPAGAVAGYFGRTWLTGDCRDGGTAAYVVVHVGTTTFDYVEVQTRRL